MIFNSFSFLIFFLVFYILYLVVRETRIRIILCLIGSYFFYGWWDYRFLSLIVFSTLVDYYLGRKLYETTDQPTRKRLLHCSLFSNLGLLFFFKYFNFFIESFVDISASIGLSADMHTLNILLPVGISFYTFQTMSYTIDIYKKKLTPENNIITFATYVAFFPQLVAGPIVRAIDLLPQFHKKITITATQIRVGLFLIVLGYFKKVVIADSIAPLVDSVFSASEAYTSLHIAIIVVFYAFQIYCDFSGYSDIAIGIGKLLGFNFPTNFNLPYFAKNFSDFWRRWHITLSSWLRDYLYITLGGNRGGYLFTQRNLMITMLLGGLWHGANWTFIIWGFLHGLYLIGQRVIEPMTNRLVQFLPKAISTIIGIAITFVLVNVAWIFFRSQSIDDAFRILVQIISMEDISFAGVKQKFQLFKIIVIISALVSCELIYYLYRDKVVALFHNSYIFQIILSCIMLWMILLFGSFASNNFIYFQF